MKTFLRNIFVGIALMAAFLPLAALAQQTGSSQASNPAFQLVSCDGATKTDPLTGAAQNACDFTALLTTVQRFINILLYISVFIAVILIVLAGFKYLTAGGDTSKTGDAKKIFRAVIIGMIISFTAWVVVYTIVTTLKPNGQDTLLSTPFSGSNNLLAPQ